MQPNRLNSTLLTSLLALAGCGSPHSSGSGDERVSRAEGCRAGFVSTADLARQAQEVGQALGIKIGVADSSCTHNGVGCRPPSELQGKLTENFLQALKDELGRYPPQFLAKHGPERIWLVADLKVSGVSWEAGGLTLDSERLIYLNVTADCDADFGRHTIHHELFHVLDRQLFVNKLWDQAWMALNPPGFAYLNDYNKVEGNSVHPDDGFVTTYAETTIAEDKAETFAFALVGAYASRLASWLPADKYLDQKERKLHFWLKDKWPDLATLLDAAPP